MTEVRGPLRIGILGAARIAPKAIIYPARQLEGVQAFAVAARDTQRANSFAAQYHLPRVHDSYAALLADPEVDAIYNPLPNSHHAEWTIRSLEAGKDVLCEKPFASNLSEAQAMAESATHSGKVLMEAFHYRYHPLMVRVLEILQSGELGQIRHVETAMCIPNWRRWDIRWQYALAGGALMDVGCYTIHLLRTLAGEEPSVTHARAWLRDPQVDRAVKADFAFASGATGHIHCSMWSRVLLKLGAKVTGDKGDLTIINPFLPHLVNSVTIRTAGGTRREHFPRIPTYRYQLAAFRDAVQIRAPFPTDPADAVANMRVIDDVYHAAGLSPRTPSAI